MKILVLCIVNFIIFTQSALALEYRQIRNTTDDQFEVIEISFRTITLIFEKSAN